MSLKAILKAILRAISRAILKEVNLDFFHFPAIIRGGAVCAVYGKAWPVGARNRRKNSENIVRRLDL